MKSSLLNRRVADYDARSRGLENYTTARDMSLILEKIYRGNLVSEEVSTKCLEILLNQKSKDRIPRYLPQGLRVAHKTGLERTVCHDAGIVFDPNGDFLIVVLTEHSNKNSTSSKVFIGRISQLVYERNNIKDEFFPGQVRNEKQAAAKFFPKKLSVHDIQAFLKNKGLYSGRVDGQMGPVTRAAVKEFQKASNLFPDGIVGAKTSRAILEYAAASEKDMFNTPSR
jgi:hypothetical protein